MLVLWGVEMEMGGFYRTMSHFLMTFLILFLASCGGAKNNDPQISELIIESITLQDQNLEFDLNDPQPITLSVISTFDDGTTKTEDFTLVWLKDENKLELKNSQDELVTLTYDSDSLLAQNNGTISFGSENVEDVINFDLTLIPLIIVTDITSQSGDSLELSVGDTSTLDFELSYSDNSKLKASNSLISCESDSPDILSSTSNCELKGLSAGNAKITVTVLQTNINAIVDIVVKEAPVEEITINNIENLNGDPTLEINDELTLQFNMNYSNNTSTEQTDGLITCSSDDVAKVSIISNCNIKANSVGTANITAKVNSNISITFQVTVSETTPSEPTITNIVSLNSSTSIKVDDELDLLFRIEYSDNSSTEQIDSLLTCTSNDETKLMILSACRVKGVSEGDVDVMVKGSTGNAISVTLTVVAKDVDPPQVTIKEFHIIGLNNNMEINDKEVLSVEGTNSDDSPIANVFQYVKCVTSSLNVSVTDHCEVTANSAGTAKIDLELINFDIGNPVLTSANVQINEKAISQIILQPFNISMLVGQSQMFDISVKYTDGLTESNVGELVQCEIVSGAEFAELINFCELNALAVGKTEIQISLLNNTNSIPAIIHQISIVDSGKIIKSGELIYLQTQDFINDASDEAFTWSLGQCDVEINIKAPLVGSDCSVEAAYPGDFLVTGVLTNPANGTDKRDVSMFITIESVQLTSDNGYGFSIQSEVYSIMYELVGVTSNQSYKVLMASVDGGTIPQLARMTVLPTATSSTDICINELPNNYNSIACGVNSSTSSIFVFVDNGFTLVGFSGQFDIQIDENISIVDGKPNALVVDDFQPLEIGQPFQGHVTSNIDTESMSRYYSSLDLGMKNKVDSGNYQLSIVFESENVDENNILFEGGSGLTSIDNSCVGDSFSRIGNTFSCELANTQQDYLFVYISGKGFSSVRGENSPSATGELDYIITLTQF